jgi:hypothetical protein
VKEIASELEIGQARFQDVPLLWLSGLAKYLNVKLEHSNPVLTPKANDYPLCVLSGEIRDVIKRAVRDSGETTIQQFFHTCLTAMADDMIRGLTSINFFVLNDNISKKEYSNTPLNTLDMCLENRGFSE